MQSLHERCSTIYVLTNAVISKRNEKNERNYKNQTNQINQKNQMDQIDAFNAIKVTELQMDVPHYTTTTRNIMTLHIGG